MNAVTDFFRSKAAPTAADDLAAALAERAKVQTVANGFEAERTKRMRATDAAEVARKRVAELRDADRAARARHNVDGTHDGDRAKRQAAIADAERAAKDAADAAATAEDELRLLTTEKLQPVLAQLREIDARLPQLERAALLEQLNAAAVDHARLHAEYLKSFGRVFALAHAATARGAVVGAGLEAHLVMPHPSLPAFKGCEIPRTFRADIQAEAQRILEGLRA